MATEGDFVMPTVHPSSPMRDFNGACSSCGEEGTDQPQINRRRRRTSAGASGPGRPETPTGHRLPQTTAPADSTTTPTPPLLSQPRRRASRAPARTRLRIPSLLVTLVSSLLLSSQLNLVRLGEAARATEVDIDWSPTSELFNKGPRRIATRYVRMKEVLHFRCPPDGFFAIMMVPEETAHRCYIDLAAETTKEIGMCGPNTGNPKVGVRPYSPIPGRPTFNAGENYYLITTSNGSENGLLNAEGGLCSSNGMRLRVSVLPASTQQRPSDSIDPFTPSPIDGEGSESAEADGSAGPIMVVEGREEPTATTLRPVISTTTHAPRQKITSVNAVQQIRQVTVKPTDAPSTTTTTTTTAALIKETSTALTIDSANGFPAILTLEQNGEKRRVIVNTAEELEWEIQRANEQSGERVNGIEGLHSSSPPSKAKKRPSSEADLNRSEYEHVPSGVEDSAHTHAGSTLHPIPPPPAPPITASNQFPRSRWTNHPRPHRPKTHPVAESETEDSEAPGSSSPLRRNVAPVAPDEPGHQVHEGAERGRSMPIFYVVGYEGDEASGGGNGRRNSAAGLVAALMGVTVMALVAILIGGHQHSLR